MLGDVDTAKPAYVRKSVKAYTLNGYSSFRSSNEARPGMVYVAANDGMLHAFNAVDGVERWAYAPRITMPKLYLQANAGYGSNHQYTVDGTPETGDVLIAGTWKTILVGGLNDGGRGYYALDITDPANPTPLWEFCSDSTICVQNDADLGLTFGNPQIGMWNNQWVVLVTSGYNNTPGTGYATSSGDGKGYLYVLRASDGTVLKKVGTTLGSTSTPSGLGKILAITNNPQIDPVISYVFGGDVLGNMWRFDLTTPTISTVPLVKLAELGSARPITTKPDAQLCAVNSGTQRVLVWGTGRLLGETDVSDTSTQSFYAIKETGTALGQLNNSTSTVQQTWTNASTATSGVHANLSVNWATKNGWYIDFSRNQGERVNIDPKIAYGTVYVSTNIPTSTGDSCSVGGSSNFNNYSVCGTVSDSSDTEGSVLSSSTSAIVGFTVIRLQNGKLIAKIKFASGSNTDLELNSKSSPAARKSGWRSIKTN